jgi:ABC-2 type transport system permease protein
MTRLGAFFERDIRLAFAYPYGLVMPFLSIIVTVAGFAYLSRLVDPHAQLRSAHEPLTYFSYVVVNLAFMLLLNGALQAVAGAIRRDQVAGTLDAVLATPAGLGHLLAGSTLWPVAFAALQAAFYLACGAAFGLHLPAVDAAGFAVVLVLSMACMVALGGLGAAVVIRYKQNPPSSLLAGGAAAMLSGALFPVSLLPVPLRDLSWMLPLTHALNGLRAALSGAGFIALAPDVLWMAATTAILGPLSLAVFSHAVRLARKDGTLSSY